MLVLRHGWVVPARVHWLWQPRLPDPSYASPALAVALEDKSGAALAWVLFPLPS